MDLFKSVEKMAAEKKEWRAQLARIKKMPKDYQIVFKEVEKYLWSAPDETSIASVEDIYRLIDFFEEGAINKVPVLDYIGSDVGAFAEKYSKEISTKQ